MHSLLEVGSIIDLLDIKCGTREWGSLTNTMPDLNVISLMKHYEGDYVQRTVLKNWHMRMHACMTWHDALLAASDCCFLGYKLASIYQRWYIVHEVSMLLAVCVQQASMYSRQQARSVTSKRTLNMIASAVSKIVRCVKLTINWFIKFVNARTCATIKMRKYAVLSWASDTRIVQEKSYTLGTWTSVWQILTRV